MNEAAKGEESINFGKKQREEMICRSNLGLEKS